MKTKTIIKQYSSPIFILTIVSICLFSYCKKDKLDVTPNDPLTTYASVDDFFQKEGVKSQFFSLSNSSGGSFTTKQGTIVTIHPYSFANLSGDTIMSDSITIEFKDIYKKGDMLLANMPTMMTNGKPLESAGEFFIRAKADNEVVQLLLGQNIEIKQPLNGLDADSAMKPFVGIDSAQAGMSWSINEVDYSLVSSAENYVFSLYQFQTPVESGTWCNSDNSTFFSSFSQTKLTLHANDSTSKYYTEVYLIFSGVNSMVHVYNSGNDNFNYWYSPVGLSCTVVAIGVNDGKLYSSFTPITISDNLTVDFTLHETTSENFKAQLSAL